MQPGEPGEVLTGGRGRRARVAGSGRDGSGRPGQLRVVVPAAIYSPGA